MNEMQAISEAYEQACARGERTALATVVNVAGSAYRRAGARMLVSEGGRSTGTISGGCLEHDVMERAAQVIATGAARLIEYDTRGGEDIVWGLGLGCNGVVQVLLESLHPGSPGADALSFISACLRERRTGVLATVTGWTQARDGAGDEAADRIVEIGERLWLDQDFHPHDTCLADAELIRRIRHDALEAKTLERAVSRSYLSGTRRLEIFYDVIVPPRPLIVFGAELDAVPLAQLARMMGRHVTVVDTRARRSTPARFREADAVLLCRAGEIAENVSLTSNTAAVLMTHNYLDDLELLRHLLPSPVTYLGLLGLRHRAAQLLAELRAGGLRLSDAQLARLHSPIGIDIGAETPEEIALAVMAEIKAASASRRAGFLRDRNAPLHEEHALALASIELQYEPRTAVAFESAPAPVCHS